MNLKSKTTTIIFTAILFFGAYNFVSSADEEPLLVSSGLMKGGENNLITLLLEIKSVKLDSEIFSDKSFLSLQDYSTEITPQPVGRTNPFSRIGSDPVVIDVATTSATTKTSGTSVTTGTSGTSVTTGTTQVKVLDSLNPSGATE